MSRPVVSAHKSKAAERLNWSRMTLYRKLAKYRAPERAAAASAGSGTGRPS